MAASVDPLTSPPITEIWVADGIYKPTSGTTRSATFPIRTDPSINIFGGFAGNETQAIQRNPALNITILSGDIGVIGNNADNSYHIVSAINVDPTNFNGITRLDGFTIRDGNAIGAASPGTGLEASGGAGVYVVGTTTLSNPAILRCIFENNTASVGAGMYITNPGCPNVCGPDVRNCTFRNNSANKGAGVYVDSYPAGQTSSPLIYNCVFHDNAALTAGSAIYGKAQASPNVHSCTITQNSCAGAGGAIQSVAQGLTGGFLNVVNCIAWDNLRNTSTSPSNDGFAQINWISASHKSVTFSDVQNYTGTGTGNITADPMFMNPGANDFRIGFGY